MVLIMKKIRIIICFFIVLGVTIVSASDFTINNLVAERITTNFQLTGAFIGPGGTAGPVGGSVVWPYSDASCIHWNPAAFGFLESRSVMIDWIPGVSQNLTNLVDGLDTEIEEALDEVREENGAPLSTDPIDIRPTPIDISADAGLHPVISGFSLGVPVKIGSVHGGLGFGYSTPIIMDFGILGSGLDVSLDAEEVLTGNNPTLINLRIRSGFNGRLQAKSHQYLIGGGFRFGNTSLGFTYTKMKLNMTAALYAKIDGLLTIDGEEYHFNDPNDTRLAPGESNNLEQILNAGLTGEGSGYKIGFIHKLSEKFQIGIVYNQPAKLKIKAYDEHIYDRLPFVSIEDSLDMDFTEIELPKYNKTYRDTVSNQMMPTLEYPSSVNFGFVLGGTGAKLALRYTIYTGDFSLGLFDNGVYGIRLKQGVGLGLDFKYFFLGASAGLGEEIIPDDEDSVLPTAILPKLNIGIRIPLNRQILLTGMLGVEPLPIIKTTFQYTF